MGRREDNELSFDLRTLELGPGEAREVTLPIPVSELVFSDEKYVPTPAEPEGQLQVTQSSSGWHFRLQVSTTFRGPCWRCLETAVLELAADVRDFHAFGRGSNADYDEDLDCEYLDGDSLGVAAMARDALIDLFPATIVCRDDCAGLCPNCGANRNSAPCTCIPDTVDSRWAGLDEIAKRLSSGE